MQRRNFLRMAATALPLVTGLTAPAFRRSASGSAIVVRGGQSRFGVPTPFRGINPNDLKLSARDTGGQLSVFWYQGKEKTGPSLHLHTEQDEIFYVLEGRYVFQLDTEKVQLEKGDLILLPRNIPHTWVQSSDTGALLYWLQPAGKMEEFFLKMTQSGGAMSKAEKEALDQSCGIVNRGPGLSADDTPLLLPQVSKGRLVRAGRSSDGSQILINGKSPNFLKVGARDTGDTLSIFEYNGREKGGPPLHVHPHQDEVFYVSEGRYLFQCGSEQFVLEPGDLIFLPRGIAHTWAQLTAVGQMIFFFQPAGQMEAFFAKIGSLPEPPSPALGAEIFAAHGMQITGPPLKY